MTVLSAPRIAWPTLFVLVAALALWAIAFALPGPAPLAIALATLAAYAVFTPLHEAAHRSLARPRLVNEIAGRLASIPLLGPFPAVRYLHLEHHKHTNDPAADPDHYSGRGPAWLRPLRWLTQDLHYYATYAVRRRPLRERIEVIATLLVMYGTAIALTAMGHGRAVLLGWLLPARLAVGILAWAFDYLPHRPHVVTAREDRYRATHAVPGRWLAIASFGQSLHLVHHLYPGVPFYRYGEVYREKQLGAGCPVTKA
jgi:beta-carotene hydroxylase